jgi:hypothetical protein
MRCDLAAVLKEERERRRQLPTKTASGNRIAELVAV